MDKLRELIEIPWVQTLFGVVALLLLAWLAAVVTRLLLRSVTRSLSKRTPWSWDDVLIKHGTFKHLARVVPMLVLHHGVTLVPGVPEWVELGVALVSNALIVLFVLLALSAALSAIEDLYLAANRERRRVSIKSYVQLAKIILFAIGAIIILAILIDRSPLTLLAGLGAVSAVLLLIFKDTILSLVASVQLSSNDMLRVGDWIEMPSQNADGDVIDVALHTVKVQNWDKTISTIPTGSLITESYRNWRGMYETGGRRIKRDLYIDVTSVRFHDAEEVERLSRFALLRDYFEAKRDELAEWNEALGEPGKLPVNQRRLSNLGTFRAYAQNYLEAHPLLNHELFTLVRQQDPGPTGIPLQMYCFTASTGWAEYENAQGDIFDHLIAILPEFGLRLFQQPTGADLRAGFERHLERDAAQLQAGADHADTAQAGSRREITGSSG